MAAPITKLQPGFGSTSGPRRTRAAAAIGVTTVAAVAASLDGSDGQTLCFFRICTDGYCPGCGGGRAAIALARGDLGRSWALHPWVPLLAAQLLVLIVLASRLGRTRVQRLLVPLLVANAVFAVILWAVRLSAGSIPSPF